MYLFGILLLPVYSVYCYGDLSKVGAGPISSVGGGYSMVGTQQPPQPPQPPQQQMQMEMQRPPPQQQQRPPHPAHNLPQMKQQTFKVRDAGHGNYREHRRGNARGHGREHGRHQVRNGRGGRHRPRNHRRPSRHSESSSSESFSQGSSSQGSSHASINLPESQGLNVDPVQPQPAFQPGMQGGFQQGMQPAFQPGGFQQGMQPAFQMMQQNAMQMQNNLRPYFANGGAQEEEESNASQMMAFSSAPLTDFKVDFEHHCNEAERQLLLTIVSESLKTVSDAEIVILQNKVKFR